MKEIGYIIYQFWDFKTRMGEFGEWQIETTNPMPEFKKRIYENLSSAEDAVRQMMNVDYSNTYYHIMPIYVPNEEFSHIREAYKKRLDENNKT